MWTFETINYERCHVIEKSSLSSSQVRAECWRIIRIIHCHGHLHCFSMIVIPNIQCVEFCIQTITCILSSCILFSQWLQLNAPLSNFTAVSTTDAIQSNSTTRVLPTMNIYWHNDNIIWQKVLTNFASNSITSYIFTEKFVWIQSLVLPMPCRKNKVCTINYLQGIKKILCYRHSDCKESITAFTNSDDRQVTFYFWAFLTVECKNIWVQFSGSAY